MPKPVAKLKKQAKKTPSEKEPDCIEPSQGEVVFEYFNNLLDEVAARRFEEHLLLCFCCQDILLNLDKIFDRLVKDKETLFPKPQPKVSIPLYRQVLYSKMAKR